MLTNAAVKAARPSVRAYKLTDGRGLALHILPTGAKSWRMRYRNADGHEQTLTFGLYPLVDLDGARARRDQARELLDRGEDPRAPRTDIVRSFEQAARAWMTHRGAGWSPVHAADVESSLERDVFPAIGAELLDAIDRPRVLELLRGVERRGAIATARRLRQRIEAVFELSRAEGWTNVDNPADVGEGLAHSPTMGRQCALVDVDELRAFMRAVSATPAAPALQQASQFLALTAVRLAALRGMRWSEVDDLDGTAPTWTVPAARMKLGVGRKGDAAFDHVVPLSAAAVGTLSAARTLAGGSPRGDQLVFIGRAGGPIGDGALGELYNRAGYAGRHVPHGWRAAFSTVMNERRGRDHRAAIDRVLGHAPKDMSKVERAYNRAQHLDDRRELLEEWGALIAPGFTDLPVRSK